jgi:hypothetical protein
MDLREGTKVAYIGPERSGYQVGDVGKIVAASGESFHVSWKSGTRKGDIELMSVLDITPVTVEATVESRSADLDDSLEYGDPILSFSARKVYEASGFDGLIGALDEDGHLATLVGRVEEMVGSLVSEVRSDPSVQQTLAALDFDEADDFVGVVTSSLVREALGKGDEE